MLSATRTGDGTTGQKIKRNAYRAREMVAQVVPDRALHLPEHAMCFVSRENKLKTQTIFSSKVIQPSVPLGGASIHPFTPADCTFVSFHLASLNPFGRRRQNACKGDGVHAHGMSNGA
jgi:hypothetical protein